jgi:hypothetical protein
MIGTRKVSLRVQFLTHLDYLNKISKLIGKLITSIILCNKDLFEKWAPSFQLKDDPLKFLNFYTLRENVLTETAESYVTVCHTSERNLKQNVLTSVLLNTFHICCRMHFRRQRSTGSAQKEQKYLVGTNVLFK